MKVFIALACVLFSTKCNGIPVEDTVVSVYTTQSSKAGTNQSLDVYHQIANNIAERITSPIYRFLGFNTTTVIAKDMTTKRPWNKIELLDDQDLTVNKDIKPVDNDITKGRDVEELSVEGISKQDKKPEKFILYSSLVPSYLPSKLETDSTTSQRTTSDQNSEEDFDSIELTDDEPKTPRQGPVIYIMEVIGSIIQLLWGGFMALFKPSSNR